MPWLAVPENFLAASPCTTRGFDLSFDSSLASLRRWHGNSQYKAYFPVQRVNFLQIL